MDHSQAIESQAAERYLLGELSAGEAEAFELHYFECPHCAAAVEAATQFIANARAAWREPKSAAGGERAHGRSLWNVAAWRPRLAFALPMAAAAVLGIVALYQGLIELPGMRQALDSARVLPAFQLTGAARGEEPQIRVPRGTPSVALSEDIPPDVHFPLYICILTSGGRSVFRVLAPAPAAGQPITLLVPVRELRPGEYQLAIYGPGGGEGDRITTYSFQFQVE